MMVMKPYDVSASVLTSSSIPEPDSSVGEVEWVEEASKRVTGSFALPSGYDYTDQGVYYNENHPTKRYYMLVRATGSTVDFAIASYDADFAYVGLKTISSGLVADSRVVGFNYVDATGIFIVVRRLVASPYTHYYQSYIDITATISTGLNPTATAISSLDSAFLTDNVSSSFVRVSDGSYYALLVDSSTPLSKLYKLAADGSSSASLTLESGIDYALTQSGDIAYLALKNTESSLVTASSYSESLSVISTIDTDSAIVDTLSGFGFSGGIMTACDYDGAGNVILSPTDSDGVNIGAYTTGDFVIKTSTHKVYKCAASATFTDPEIGVLLDTPTWVEYGYTNRYKQFTNAYDSQSEYSGIINVFDFGEVVTAVGLLGVEAETAQIVVNDPTDGEVYNEIVNLADAGVNNWWDWFFKPYDSIDNYVFSGLPPYPDATVTLTLDNGTSAAKCGLMLSGLPIDLGDTNTETEVGIINYTTRSRDEFGNLTVTPKRSINYCNYAITCEIGDVNNIKRLLRGIADTQALFIGESDLDATIVYGVAEDFRLNYSGVSICNYTLEVKGA